MRRSVAACCLLSVLSAGAHALAEPKEDKKDKAPLPRLGLDPAEPLVRSAPPALPFGISPATSKEYVLDFHGYLLLPLRLGIHRREDPASGQAETVLHAPPLIPQSYRKFEYTAVVPDPWVQLNFTYGNSTVSGTAILAASAIGEGEAAYDPVRQVGVAAAYVTANLTEPVGVPLQLRVGAMPSRYGSMGAFDAGRYATPLIARVNSVGETATIGVDAGKSTFVVEQAFGGQLGRTPAGLTSAGFNDFADPDGGASFVTHLHGGWAFDGLLQLGGHYVVAWSQDDQNIKYALKRGSISVYGGDARLTSRYGHLYLGAAQTKAVNSEAVSGVIEVLNARGGKGLIDGYFGPKSDGDGALTTFGLEYDVSLSRAVFGDDFRGKNPDVLISLFGIGTKVKSDDKTKNAEGDPAYDGVLKLKGGGEVTYNIVKWFGASGRVDHVRLDNRYNRQAYNTFTSRLLFHTDWQSRDEFAFQYSYFVYGKEVNVEYGYPPVVNPSLNPDKHVFSLSATFWW